MEGFSSPEDIRQNVRNLLEDAQKRALTFERVQELDKEIQRLKNEQGDHSEEISELEHVIDQSTVAVHTLPEFKMLLQEVSQDKEQQITEEEVLDVLAHENAHANMVDVVGATNLGYRLLVCKKEGTFTYKPWAQFNHPEEWLTNEKLADVIRVFNAPKEYGGYLSEGDKSRIKELEKDLPKKKRVE